MISLCNFNTIFEKVSKTKTKNSIHKIFMHVKVLIPVVLLTVSLTGWETVAVVALTFVAKFCCETALRRWHNSVNEFSNVLFSHSIFFCHTILYPCQNLRHAVYPPNISLVGLGNVVEEPAGVLPGVPRVHPCKPMSIIWSWDGISKVYHPGMKSFKGFDLMYPLISSLYPMSLFKHA